MKTVMNQAATIESSHVPRSSFNRSHGYKTTFNANEIVPIFVDECYPGDTFKMNATMFARMATPIYPVMDNLFLDTFWFYCPFRLIWNNFTKFMGEQIDPGDSIDYTIPQMVSTATTGYLAGSLHDYFGLPTEVPDLTHSALFHRAYYEIWNTWFRDQNLQDSLVYSKGDGPDLPASFELQKRGKRADYFTTGLPAPQRGEAISLPLGTSAPVTADTATDADALAFVNLNGDQKRMNIVSSIVTHDSTGTGDAPLYANLAEATSATVNALRLSIQLQVMVERDARGGTRYPEITQSHFGVTSPLPLYRPEFLGGTTIRVNINPVAQTSESNTTKQGTLAGIGTLHGNSGFTKSFVEHGLIIGAISVRADLTYQQGLDRMWSRLTRYDHYFPALAHLGEQSILNKELFAQGTAADDLVFAYQERWSELRSKPSKITGQFRSNHATSLDAWHLSQDFATLPTLNSTFIEENVPMNRVLAVPSEPDFIFDSYMALTCVRPLPIYSTPGFGGKL